MSQKRRKRGEDSAELQKNDKNLRREIRHRDKRGKPVRVGAPRFLQIHKSGRGNAGAGRRRMGVDVSNTGKTDLLGRTV